MYIYACFQRKFNNPEFLLMMREKVNLNSPSKVHVQCDVSYVQCDVSYVQCNVSYYSVYSPPSIDTSATCFIENTK